MTGRLAARGSNRLSDYDYSAAGYYAVTIAAHGGHHLFGEIEEGEMICSDAGIIVKRTFLSLPERFASLGIDEFVVMPNHFHGIIALGLGYEGVLPQTGNQPALPRVVQAFKSISTIQINRRRNQTGKIIWQRNYHDRIIRNDAELEQWRLYISENPKRWKPPK